MILMIEKRVMINDDIKIVYYEILLFYIIGASYVCNSL